MFPIVVPPLRERCDDLPALIDDLVRRGEADGRPSIAFTETALDCLSAYSWPGNVRELQNLIERLAILYPNQTIDREQLPTPIGERRRNVQPSLTDRPEDGARSARVSRQHREATDSQRPRSGRRHRRSCSEAPEAAAHDARREAAQVRAPRARVARPPTRSRRSAASIFRRTAHRFSRRHRQRIDAAGRSLSANHLFRLCLRPGHASCFGCCRGTPCSTTRWFAIPRRT